MNPKTLTCHIARQSRIVLRFASFFSLLMVFCGLISTFHMQVSAQQGDITSDRLCTNGFCRDLTAQEVQALIDLQDESYLINENELTNSLDNKTEFFDHQLKLADSPKERSITMKDNIASMLFFVIVVLFILLAINGLLILILGLMKVNFAEILIKIETWVFRTVIFFIAAILVVMYI